MKSWSLVEFGKPLELRETPTPEPKGTEVLLRVRRCGVCHSDVHLSHGYFDFGDGRKFNLTERGMKLPMTMGHEVLGEVVKAGPEAGDVPVGKTFLVNPWIGCNECEDCREGRENDCVKMNPIGVTRDGGYATHVIVPHPHFLVDVEGLDPSTVTPFACSGVTVYSGLKKLMPFKKGSWTAVLGAGGLGLVGVNIAKALGAEKVVAVDIDDAKLEAAKGMGADAVLNSAKAADPVAALQELCGGMLLQVLDTVGNEKTSALGTLALRKTGRYVIVGLHGGTFRLPLPLLPQRAMTVRGSYVGSSRDLAELIDLVKAGKVKAAPITERPLDMVGRTIAELEEGKVLGRVVLTTE